MTVGKLVTGMVKNRAEADTAITRIMNLGYQREDISFIMSEAAREQHIAFESGTQAAAGAGVGGALGGAWGAVLAAIAALGTTVIFPGFVIAGPIVAALVGAGAGGATGTMIGALVGAGIPEERAQFYETGLASGNIVLGVSARTESDATQIEHILEDVGATRIRVDAPQAQMQSMR
jgi:Heat induced stress protein YflT